MGEWAEKSGERSHGKERQGIRDQEDDGRGYDKREQRMLDNTGSTNMDGYG